METFRQDVRFAVRLLAKNPGFAVIAVLTLALGIGANATIFSWLNSVLLHPLPGTRDQGELVSIFPSSPAFRVSGFSYPDYLDYREQNTVLEGLTIHDFAALTLGGGAGPELLWGQIVSANFFEVLGVKPLHGRTFLPEEDKDFGAHPVIVISYPLWQRRFGADPGIVGKTVRLNNSPYTIVGVAPRGFQGGEIALAFDAWIPITMYQQIAGDDSYRYRGKHPFTAVGRLKGGVSIEQAQAGFNVIARQLASQYPETNDKWTAVIYPLWKSPRGGAEVLSTVLIVLMGTVGVVLLIACANVANLLLARASRRAREIAIRLSVGASRVRLLRQLLTESILLALLGGAVGIMVSLWTSGLITTLAPPSELPIRVMSGVDSRVVLFTFALSILTGIIFGLAPALQASRINVVSCLKEEGGAVGWKWRKAWLRNSLVISQVALSLILLIAASLFLRSLGYARSISLGFQPRNVLLASVDLFPCGYSAKTGCLFQQELLDKVGRLPGVRSASLTNRVPLGFGGMSAATIRVEGYEPAKDETVWTSVSKVGPNYCRVMEIPLIRGRDIASRDTNDAPAVTVINETLARRYWRGSDPVGRRILWGDRAITIVGIVRDSKYRRLDETPFPVMLVPLQQHYDSSLTIMIRTEGDPARMSASLHSAIGEMDSNLPIFATRTFEDHIGAAAFRQRFASTLLSVFGALALFLAAIGVYGVISCTVTQQTREFGIRIALGARPQDLLWWVVRHGMGITASGIAIGLAAAWGVTRVLRSLLLGVDAYDPLTFAGVTLVLALVSLAACLIPARRAARVDPIISLRYE